MPSLRELLQEAMKDEASKLLKDRGMNPEDLGLIKEVVVSDWDLGIKNADGDPVKVPMQKTSFVLHPSWDQGPSWPVVQPAAPVKITPNRPKPTRDDGWRTAVILPDPQIGYRRKNDDTLEAFHDESAIEVALQVLSAARKAHPIDRVVNLGDFLDLPGQGRFHQEAGFALTTQKAIDYGHQFLARQRAICPDSHISVIEGNHDKRLGNYVESNAKEAFGLRRAGDPPDSWPTLTIPYLLRVDDLGVEWIEGYPAGGVWLNDHIMCVHGNKVRSSGSTASAMINDSRHSLIFGHVHRIEVQYKTDKGREASYRKFAATPGCLCRVDGAVPSVGSAVSKSGGSVTNYENWQQGLMIVQYRDDDHRYALETVEISNGRAMWRGKEYVAGGK